MVGMVLCKKPQKGRKERKVRARRQLFFVYIMHFYRRRGEEKFVKKPFGWFYCSFFLRKKTTQLSSCFSICMSKLIAFSLVVCVWGGERGT